MRSSFLLLLFALFIPTTRAQDPWVVYRGKEGLGLGKHIVLISGDEEYRSEEALPMLARILAVRHGFTCTVLFAIDPDDGTIDPMNQTNIPGLEALDTADMMVIFTRFRELPDASMKHLSAFVDSGKPMFGIRTATHAFDYRRNRSSPHARFTWRNNEWPDGFGKQVLGETWVNHHGAHNRQATRGIINTEFADHPIVKGVRDIFGPTDVYGVRKLPEGSKVLVWGQVLRGMSPDDEPAEGPVNNPMMPLIWIREFKGAGPAASRVIASTIGASVDLLSEDLRRAFVNACYWGLGLEDRIPDRSDVRHVGPYHPRHFGFDRCHPGVKPSDLSLEAPSPPSGLRLAGIFSDHMVLQRGTAVEVWGFSDPMDRITVRFAGQEKSSSADVFGRWSLELDAMASESSGRSLEVQGTRAKIALADVLVGDVWIWGGSPTVDAILESHANAPQAPPELLGAVRFFNVAPRARALPQVDLQRGGSQASWAPSATPTHPAMPPGAHHFANALLTSRNVPVGVIAATWPEAPPWAWASANSQRRHEPTKEDVESRTRASTRWSTDGAAEAHAARVRLWREATFEATANGQPKPPAPPSSPDTDPTRRADFPGGAHNAMLVPIAKFSFCGIVFDPGDQAPPNPELYGEILPLILTDWRQTFREPKLPIVLLQGAGSDSQDPELAAWRREVQLATHQRTTSSGLVVTNDVQHLPPRERHRLIGIRAAHCAHAQFDGSVPYRPPLYDAVTQKGARLVISFKPGTASHLTPNSVEGFTIAGHDQKFVPARAEVKNDLIEVWSDTVQDPTALRYGFGSAPGNLRNGDLPASSFRTDTWPIAKDR